MTLSNLTDVSQDAKQKLDAQVREVIQWHFDPDNGTPFWLDFAKTLQFDPRKTIQSYDDLRLLGHFQDKWLRGGPVRRWVPKIYQRESAPVSVFETGGSTGVPKYRTNINDFRTDYELFSHTLRDESFPKGSDWLMLGPTGPRRLRMAIEHLAQFRGGIAFHVDLDPRWVNKLIKAQKFQEMETYKRHVIDQALTILRANPNIHCIFTTPKLLEALAEHIDLVRYGIKGIFCGGTEMNAQFHRFAREELVPGVDFVPTYGNTLMGLACSPPWQSGDPFDIVYYPPQPRAVFEIVDPDDTEKSVSYGETGRVMLTTLTKEFFMPRFLERDEGERVPPRPGFPYDGVQNLRLFSRFQTNVVVGVY